MESIISFMGSFFGSQGFYHFAVGIGIFFLGLSSLFVIPKKLNKEYKSEVLSKKYERFLYHMLRNSMTMAKDFELPKHNELVIEDFLKNNGWKKSKSKDYRKLKSLGIEILEDIMHYEYFKYVQGNANVSDTVMWDKKTKRIDSIDEFIK